VETYRHYQASCFELEPYSPHLCRPADMLPQFTNGHFLSFSPLLIAMTAAEITTLGQMPLDKKIKRLCCRTGNYLPFHFFQL